MRNPLFLCSLLTVGLAGCGSVTSGVNGKNGGHDKGGELSGISSVNGKTLAINDMAAISSLDESSIKAYDRSHNRVFTAVFGGTSKKHVRGFLNQRIKRIFGPEDLKSATTTPKEFKYENYLKDDPGNATQREESEKKGQLMAVNLGTSLWLRGAVDEVPVTLTIGSESIPVRSPRTGLMVVGPGYVEKITGNSGKTIQIPASFRQATLVHEARHSDCTSGVSRADLEIGRQARNIREFTKEFPVECGHMHVICGKDHALAGLSACDRQAWGAYAVGAIFIAALAQKATDPVEKALLDAAAIDNFSRLDYDSESLFNGRLGKPDMASRGMREHSR